MADLQFEMWLKCSSGIVVIVLLCGESIWIKLNWQWIYLDKGSSRPVIGLAEGANPICEVPLVDLDDCFFSVTSLSADQMASGNMYLILSKYVFWCNSCQILQCISNHWSYTECAQTEQWLRPVIKGSWKITVSVYPNRFNWLSWMHCSLWTFANTWKNSHNFSFWFLISDWLIIMNEINKKYKFKKSSLHYSKPSSDLKGNINR